MSLPVISVVVTCFNRSEYLRETLSCLQRQTLENWEALIVDDYSEENIKAVVDSFKDPRFRYIRNEGPKGPSAARNLGNRQAQAELIAVADSDDIILPRRLQVSYEYFQTHPETNLFYGNIYSFAEGTYDFSFYRHFAQYNRDGLYDKDFIPHVTVVYRKEDILHFPYDESLHSAIDYDMLLQFADAHKQFGYTTEPLVLYRRHDQQISTDPERKVKQLENAVKIRERHAPYRHKPIA